MKRDVGMACQKVHEQERIEVMVNIQSFIPTSFHKTADVGIGLCIFTITSILSCSCTFWPFLHLFIFNDFSFLFLYFFGNVLIYVVK